MFCIHLIVYLLFELSKADRPVTVVKTSVYPIENDSSRHDLTKDNETVLSMVNEKAQDWLEQGKECINEGKEAVLGNGKTKIQDSQDAIKNVASEATEFVKKTSEQRWNRAKEKMEDISDPTVTPSEEAIQNAGNLAQNVYEKGNESFEEGMAMDGNVIDRGTEYATKAKRTSSRFFSSSS
jgi:vacuolar-type H+-ATPase subunit H